MDITIAYQRALQQHPYKYIALYYALRENILNGSLQPGMRLPSTRELAASYGVSRGSAAEAYDLLLAEGYTESAVGRGTYVARQLTSLPVIQHSTKKEQPDPKRSAAVSTADPSNSYRTLSRWGNRLLEMDQRQPAESPAADDPANLPITPLQRPATMISFAPREILLEGRSLTDWRSAMTGAARDLQQPVHSSGQREEAGGDLLLREAICSHLGRTRGIAAQPEQIVLCSGSMEAIVLLCQLLINEGEPVILEDPCYPGISRAITACGGQVCPAPLDRQGIIPQDWDSRLLFVTPGRQFPTGVVLPLPRRQQLLQWAEHRQAWIVEDDYDSEFRWEGRPVEPLKALDTTDSVIYVGSFSKSMFSSLRLGYAIMPPGLAQALIAAKRLYDPLPSSRLEQRALARFIMRGDYMRHLRRMTRLYRGRHAMFREQVEQQLRGVFSWMPVGSGLHVYGVWQHDRESYAQFRQIAAGCGVRWRDAADYQLTEGTPAGCFSFAHLEEEQIIEGIRRLRNAWNTLQSTKFH
ncbi:PLP-dependent aminotransferase family protein [Paenibacillus bovis]|uniref:Transcriptional regulator n=1 Tax=Paenibacillus bovis TaxID=1616788 RepID=A0A172ZKG5_9BACL|nr:PLP-dependent aminotransferase family protein [Paenibacillus bovis]ANF98135.1 transcriptional regulator [Paenibacillus bovis]